MVWNLLPEPEGDGADLRQLHVPVYELAEEILALSRADRDEVPTICRVIPPLQPDGLNSISVSLEAYHRSLPYGVILDASPP